ncbi:MAG: DUF4488 domain-containing protein [Dysgonamonadaceae bacterium]|nr:DUF4488 domain-containing protein [Dysgonamonadaceae bacterium]
MSCLAAGENPDSRFAGIWQLFMFSSDAVSKTEDGKIVIDQTKIQPANSFKIFAQDGKLTNIQLRKDDDAIAKILISEGSYTFSGDGTGFVESFTFHTYAPLIGDSISHKTEFVGEDCYYTTFEVSGAGYQEIWKRFNVVPTTTASPNGN